MIVLGFLSYHDGYLKIPNKELMKEFEKALKDESFGYVSEIIDNSKKMLKATVKGDNKIVEEILHDIHNSEIPILQYNDENSLSCVLTLAYLSARDTYRIEIDALESLPFTLKNSEHPEGVTAFTHTINSNIFEINITKSFFSFSFGTGSNGDRITEDIVIASVNGVQLQKLEVYRNDKFVKEFSAEELTKWEEVIENTRTFGDNGRYTFRMTDKFGNTYEPQIEKYYKVNVALVLLIAIVVALLVFMIFFIIKIRNKVNVK